MNSWELSSDHEMPKKGRDSKYPFKDMEVGQSFFVSGTTTAGKETIYAYNYGRKAGKRFSARAVDGGVRIWRVE